MGRKTDNPKNTHIPEWAQLVPGFLESYEKVRQTVYNYFSAFWGLRKLVAERSGISETAISATINGRMISLRVLAMIVNTLNELGLWGQSEKRLRVTVSLENADDHTPEKSVP